jgi:hypothetical protein
MREERRLARRRRVAVSDYLREAEDWSPLDDLLLDWEKGRHNG